MLKLQLYNPGSGLEGTTRFLYMGRFV